MALPWNFRPHVRSKTMHPPFCITSLKLPYTTLCYTASRFILPWKTWKFRARLHYAAAWQGCSTALKVSYWIHYYIKSIEYRNIPGWQFTVKQMLRRLVLSNKTIYRIKQHVFPCRELARLLPRCLFTNANWLRTVSTYTWSSPKIFLRIVNAFS